MAAIYRKQGELIPLHLQLGEFDTGLFVEAIVKNESGVPHASSPVDLSDVGDGLYTDNSIPQPAGILIATYKTYKDAGKTVLACQEAGTDIFLRDTISDIDLPERNDTFIAVFAEETNILTAVFEETDNCVLVLSDTDQIVLSVNDSDTLVGVFPDDDVLTAVIEC